LLAIDIFKLLYTIETGAIHKRKRDWTKNTNSLLSLRGAVPKTALSQVSESLNQVIVLSLLRNTKLVI